MDSTAFTTAVYPFLASIPRIAAIFVVMPLFGAKTVRGIVRNEFILIHALFLYPMIAAAAPANVPIGISLFVVAAKEAFVGVTIGFFLGTLFWVAEHVGALIDAQTGTDNAQIYDPASDHQEGPTAGFMLQFVIVLTMAGGGLLTILEIIFESYRIWPVFDLVPRFGEAFASLVWSRADTLFALTIKFAAPMIVLLLLVDLGLGLINRIAEHIDVYTMAMPIKSMVAFFTLLVFLTFIHDSLRGFLVGDNEALRVLQEMV